MPPDSVYPACTAPLHPFLRGRAFFPGGSGLSGGINQPLAKHPIMIVGQDFDTLSAVDTSRAGSEIDESQVSTWHNLLCKMLHPNGVDPTSCFFTNAVLGARRSGTNSDPNPALNDDRFMDACKIFMLKKIKMMQPSVIIALGIKPAALLARWLLVAPDLRAPRKHTAPSVAVLDGRGLQFTPNVCVPESGQIVAFGWSIHPAYCERNLRRRSWPARGLNGKEANDLVWREAVIARQAYLANLARNA